MKGIGEGGSEKSKKQQDECTADKGSRGEKERPSDAHVFSPGVLPSIQTQRGLDVVGHMKASNDRSSRQKSVGFLFFPSCSQAERWKAGGYG